MGVDVRKLFTDFLKDCIELSRLYLEDARGATKDALLMINDSCQLTLEDVQNGGDVKTGIYFISDIQTNIFYGITPENELSPALKEMIAEMAYSISLLFRIERLGKKND